MQRMTRTLLTAAAIALAVTFTACSSGSNHDEPLADPDCSNATVRATVGEGEQAFTVSETDSNQWFCFSYGDQVGLDSDPAGVATPRLTDQGSLQITGSYSLFVLPTDTPQAAKVIDETGAAIPFAQTADGDHIMVIDVAGPDLGPDGGDPIVFTMLDAQGNTLAELPGYR